MFRKLIPLTVVTLLLAASVVFAGCAKDEEDKLAPRPKDSEQEVVKVAIPPCSDPLEGFKRFRPLAEYLAKETGFKVELVIPDNFDQFDHLIAKDKTDFVFQNSYSYVLDSTDFNQQFLIKALTPEGESSHRGVVVVRKDSGLNKIEDLKGKNMLFGPKRSDARYLAVKLPLEKEGVKTQDLNSYSFGESCEDAALNVYLKQVDAGAMCSYSYEEMLEEKEGDESEVDMSKMTVISQTQVVPNWVFAPLKNTSKTVIEKVNEALLKLNREDPGHKKLLEGAELGGFTKATDEEYNMMRDLAKEIQETK